MSEFDNEFILNQAKERKLNDKQVKFIEKNYDKLNLSGDPDKLNDELNTFVDDQLKEFKAQAEIFGYKIDDKETKDDKTEDGKNTPSTDDLDINYDDQDDLMNPEKNPLIPKAQESIYGCNSIKNKMPNGCDKII